jgi:hypothetical protein
MKPIFQHKLTGGPWHPKDKFSYAACLQQAFLNYDDYIHLYELRLIESEGYFVQKDKDYYVVAIKGKDKEVSESDFNELLTIFKANRSFLPNIRTVCHLRTKKQKLWYETLLKTISHNPIKFMLCVLDEHEISSIYSKDLTEQVFIDQFQKKEIKKKSKCSMF